LGNWGHNRDGKRGKLQIVIGLLADGEPRALRVFEGNTADCTTVAEQIRVVKEQFGVKGLVFVGDRGMVKAPEQQALNAQGWRKNRSRAAGVMAAWREVIEPQGVFCSIYSDRARHFFETPKAGGAVDRRRLRQMGRALKELGVEMIPAYSRQARGRRERNFGIWQGRLPQELRRAGDWDAGGGESLLAGTLHGGV
jgi:hypothetical protein